MTETRALGAEHASLLCDRVAEHSRAQLAAFGNARREFHENIIDVLLVEEESSASLRAAVTERLASMDTRLVNLALEYADALCREVDAEVAENERAAEAISRRIVRERVSFLERARRGSSPVPNRPSQLAARAGARARVVRACEAKGNRIHRRIVDRGDRPRTRRAAFEGALRRRWSRLRTAPSFGKNGFGEDDSRLGDFLTTTRSAFRAPPPDCWTVCARKYTASATPRARTSTPSTRRRRERARARGGSAGTRYGRKRPRRDERFSRRTNDRESVRSRRRRPRGDAGRGDAM